MPFLLPWYGPTRELNAVDVSRRWVSVTGLVAGDFFLSEKKKIQEVFGRLCNVCTCTSIPTPSPPDHSLLPPARDRGLGCARRAGGGRGRVPPRTCAVHARSPRPFSEGAVCQHTFFVRSLCAVTPS